MDANSLVVQLPVYRQLEHIGGVALGDTEVVEADDVRDNEAACHKLLSGVCRIGIIIVTASKSKQSPADAVAG